MTVRITVIDRSAAEPSGGVEHVIEDAQLITIGRDAGCQLVLADEAVSRSHARIIRDGAFHFVEDLGSASGTSLNGKSLTRGERSLLRDGDVVAIARFDLRLGLPGVGDESTALLARRAMRHALGAVTPDKAPCLRILNGPREGERIHLADAQELIIGREEGAHLLLEGDLVSRRHAKVRRDWSGTHLEDLGSRNGVRVNRKRVARERLVDRDEIEIGDVRMLFLDPAATRDASVAVPRPPPAATALQIPASEGLPTPERQEEEAPLPPHDGAEIKRFIPIALAGLCALVAIVFVVLIFAGL